MLFVTTGHIVKNLQPVWAACSAGLGGIHALAWCLLPMLKKTTSCSNRTAGIFVPGSCSYSAQAAEQIDHAVSTKSSPHAQLQAHEKHQHACYRHELQHQDYQQLQLQHKHGQVHWQQQAQQQQWWPWLSPTLQGWHSLHQHRDCWQSHKQCNMHATSLKQQSLAWQQQQQLQQVKQLHTAVKQHRSSPHLISRRGPRALRKPLRLQPVAELQSSEVSSSSAQNNVSGDSIDSCSVVQRDCPSLMQKQHHAVAFNSDSLETGHHSNKPQLFSHIANDFDGQNDFDAFVAATLHSEHFHSQGSNSHSTSSDNLVHSYGAIDSQQEANSQEQQSFVQPVHQHNPREQQRGQRRHQYHQQQQTRKQQQRPGPEQQVHWPSARRALDLSNPAAWYLHARAMRRHLVAHLGPTNSGKTHAALEALKSAKSGVYCGPLRLLACEVADRLNAAGIPCDLVTGQEVWRVPGARHTACTVEMADLEHQVEVAVLDEIQMVGDKGRGWSWTRALLGLPAHTLHLCGDTAASKLVSHLAKQCNDPLIVHTYRRLSPLIVEPQALSSLSEVQEGDCIVAFGRRTLHSLRRQILSASDEQSGVGMLYGALPPEARRSQAALFNAAKGAWPRSSILVASDAIGMGLNLNIRRIVFAALHKYDGSELRALQPSEVKQIAGRAGRYNSGHAAGYVSTLRPSDMSLLRRALATVTPPIAQACLLPRFEQLEEYAAACHGRLKLHRLLQKFSNAAQTSDCYFLGDMGNMVALARTLGHLEPLLDLEDMHTWCTSPASSDDPAVMQALVALASQYATNRQVTPDVISHTITSPPATQAQMKAAEELFRVYDLYLWLEGRMAPGVFQGKKLVQERRQAVADLIDEGLCKMGGLRENRESSGSTASDVVCSMTGESEMPAEAAAA